MTTPLDPAPLLQILSGARMNAALVSVLELGLAGHLAKGPCTAKELASRASISERGAQALLDVLVALGVCEVAGGVYKNGPLADAFLVRGRPAYLGDAEVSLFREMYASWLELTRVVRTGKPLHENDDPKMLEFWTSLTPHIGHTQRPLAEEAVRWLGLTKGEPNLLDVGGGAALFSLALLRQNPAAHATQLDWPHVNRIARAEIDAAGLSARFETLDGDFKITEVPANRYDVAVLSNIVHQESEASALALMKRLRNALRPGGRLLVVEFVVDDGRTGPAMPLLFNLNMVLNTSGGRSYERAALTRLFRDAGFAEPELARVGPVSTLIVAQRDRSG